MVCREWGRSWPSVSSSGGSGPALTRPSSSFATKRSCPPPPTSGSRISSASISRALLRPFARRQRLLDGRLQLPGRAGFVEHRRRPVAIDERQPAGMGRDYNDRDAGRGRISLQATDHRPAVEPGQIQVERHRRRLQFGCQPDGRLAVSGAHDPMPGALEDLLKEQRYHRIVFAHQDGPPGGPARTHRRSVHLAPLTSHLTLPYPGFAVKAETSYRRV